MVLGLQNNRKDSTVSSIVILLHSHEIFVYTKEPILIHYYYQLKIYILVRFP